MREFEYDYYFLTSRSIATLCGIRDEKDIEELRNTPFGGTEKEKLVHRFLLTEDELEEEDLVSKIKRHSAEVRENYLRYMNF